MSQVEWEKVEKELRKVLEQWNDWVFQEGVVGRLKDKNAQEIKIKEESK